MYDDEAPTEPAGAPPSGNVTPTATCCPLVTGFDASPQSGRTTGYDRRTNLAQVQDRDEYWIPPSKAKVVPGDRYRQDGAGWASVHVDGLTDLEVSFEGQSGNGCIANCVFEAMTPGIVRIVTPKVAGNEAIFQLRGLAEGETTIRVTCDGAEIGWVHVVCYELLALKVGVASVVGGATREAVYATGRMQRILNEAFSPAGIHVEVTDLGAIDFSSWPEWGEIEETYRMETTEPGLVDGWGMLPAGTKVVQPGTGPLGLDGPLFPWQFEGETEWQKQQHGLDIVVYYYIPTDAISRRNGAAADIPASTVMLYKDFADRPAPYGPDYAYWTLAHEIGHALGLHHPNAAGADELPAHLTSSVGQQVRAGPGTNAEIAVDPSATPVPLVDDLSDNIMARDPLNLMGYWPAFTQATYLRKLQWDTVRRNIRERK